MRLQILFNFLCLLQALCALPMFTRANTPSDTTSASNNKSNIRIGLSKNLLFSGFTDDGLLKYEMSAASATPRADVVSSVGVAGTWALNTVQLRLFHGGVPFATVTAADCLFSNRSRSERTANSPNELAMDSAAFRVNGKNWIWQNMPQAQIIKLQDEATMTLKARPSAGRVDIFSKQLEATKHEQGAEAGRVIFVFSGDVRVIMENLNGGGDTTITGEQLIVRLKNTGRGTEKITELAATANAPAKDKTAKKKSGKNEKTPGTPGVRANSQTSHLPDILENIEILGNVRISARNRQMSGDRTIYDHASQTLTTLGNARIEDPAPKVSVAGGKIVYHHANARAEVSRADASPNSEEPPQVHLSIPSFTTRTETDKDTERPPADVYGDTLTLSMSEKTNHITMSGRVRVQDPKFASSSQRISVETPHDARLFAGFAPGAPALVVNHVITEGDVHASYEGSALHCEKVTLHPAPGNSTLETAVLTGTPVLDFGNVKLRGHTITLNAQKHQANVTSEPDEATERQRVQVFLPALKGGSSNTATIISSDKLFVAETAGREKAKFDFTGDVRLKGFELEGQCDYLGLLADIRAPLETAKQRNRPQGEHLAHIHNMTATGNVRLATPQYIAEGGEAVMLPRVALTEKNTLDDNGLDGAAPQFFTLRPHDSTPGKRPRLTFRPARAFKLDSFMPTTPPSDKARPASTSGTMQQGPIHMDCDFLEIIGGAMRSRFFLRNNVTLEGPDIHGGCDIVEGSIIEEKVPRNKQPATARKSGAQDLLPDYSLNSISRIIGRENVRLHIKESEATGHQFEIFPQKKEIHLTGDPQVTNNEGVRVTPGKAFIYNWGTRNWEMKGENTATGTPISRPTIHIPMDEPLDMKTSGL
ncbi:MAG: LptA/OstA family protein [Puniceicoccales bacterium]|nr:LptA/OstA family protein [Puniceicoccales bacterium]